MGMFDSLKCNYPLPLPLEAIDLLPDVYSLEFQTKDFDNTMSEYILDESGKLLYNKCEYEWVDDDDAFLKGTLKLISEEIVPHPYHGVVNFYFYETVYGPGEDQSVDVTVDYLAKFSDGYLVDIEVLNYEITDSSDRQIAIREMIKESARQSKLWYNRYFLDTRPWRTIKRRIILRTLGYIQHAASAMTSFVVRYL